MNRRIKVLLLVSAILSLVASIYFLTPSDHANKLTPGMTSIAPSAVPGSNRQIASIASPTSAYSASGTSTESPPTPRDQEYGKVPNDENSAHRMIKNAHRVEVFEYPANEHGEYKRITVYERTEPNKYPFFRVVELRKLDSTQEKGYVEISRTLSVADHFVLKLKPGTSRAVLEQSLSKSGYQVLEYRPISDLYLITSKTPTIQSIEAGIEKLSEEPFVKYSTPNHIIFAL